MTQPVVDKHKITSISSIAIVYIWVLIQKIISTRITFLLKKNKNAVKQKEMKPYLIPNLEIEFDGAYI